MPPVSTPVAVKKGKAPLLCARGQEPPLPRPFELPLNFSPSISSALEKKRLTGTPRAKFITVVSQSIYRFKNYPTDDEYFHVAQEMVKKWSFLDEGKGLVN